MNISKLINTPLSELDVENIPENQRALYKILAGALVYIPLLLVFNAFGFIIIYFLTLFGLLDAPDEKLLGVAAISLIAAALHYPIQTFFRQKKFDLIIFSLYLVDGSASVAQLFFWEGPAALIFFSMLAISPAAVFLPLPGITRRTRLSILAMAILFGLAIFGLEFALEYPRLQTINLSGMAALTIYATVMVVMITLVVTNAIQFRTIASRLIITFAFITIVSAVSTLVISSLVNLFREREKTFEQLEVISTLKSEQMLAILDGLESNASQPVINDTQVRQRVLYLIEQVPGTVAYDLNYQFVDDAIKKSFAQSQEYQEIYIFDDSGRVVVSSAKQNENTIISGEAQFAAATRGQRYILLNSPFASQQSIIILSRIERNGQFRGAFAIRIRTEVIRAIFEQRSALGESLETYLVIRDLSAFTLTQAGPNASIETQATESIFSQRQNAGQAIYENYGSQRVLGYYQYLPDLDAAIISEISQDEVAEQILELLITSVALGVFTAALTLTIVLFISRSISNPIVVLAQKASQLAQGDLSARINIQQADEIGTLAKAFNSLGNELKTLIETLEQQVEDRTLALQKQANRLRVSAEVARDATTSQDLDELLTRSAQLVMDRFGFYHTGVFLIDPQREYAVLRASPTKAGQEMLRREHRLRIGQVGIVGYAAATGEPRIALDTGQDVAYFNNPLLPNTRSELGLPLVVNNEVIGVLDVQSEQPDAFTQEDIASLQVMADQLALAIQRAQFSEELQRNLQELEFAYQRFTLSSWQQIAEEDEKSAGYKYDGLRINSVKEPSKESLQAIRHRQTIIKKVVDDTKSQSRTTLAIPIKVRDQVIGAIDLEFASEELPQDTVRLVEEISNRLAMSLENARLYSETQKLAEKERLAGDISNRIGSSINIETILRTTVQEISRFAPGAEIMVSLNKNKDD